MAKYIFLFCILLGVFLVSGFESVSGDMKEYKELRVTGLQQGKTECNISEAGAEQCRKVVYGGEYASKAIGNIATSVSRSNIPSSQVLRFNALWLCKLNCVMLYSHLISSVGDRPAPRGGTTRPDERKITTI